MILDAHAHVYAEDENRYPPMKKPLRPPGNRGTPDGLQTLMRENQVAGACIVQTTSFYEWDNSYLLDAAKANPKWTAGVCTINPDDPHAPGLLLKYVSEYGVRALRSYTAASGHLDHPGVAALWKACVQAGIVVNVRVWQKSADELARMIERFGSLPVVIDHCLYLQAGPEHDTILAHLIRLAKFPNAHAKLTFLPTGSAEPYPFSDMHESCRKIIAAYTPNRCVWGSNYPNELWTPKCSYAEHLRLFTEALGLGEAAKDAILHTTPRRLYFRGKLS
jgi:predicted TIM-barrel fold metal-dependent hydrolase